GLDDVRVAVLALGEGLGVVDLDVDDVVPLRDAGDVDPLAAELLEVPVGPAGGDPLVGADVAAALVVVRVLEQVLETKGLLVPLGGHGPVQVEELVVREVTDVVVLVAVRVYEPARIGVVRVGGAADLQVAASAVDEDGIEPEEPPVTAAADRALDQLAVPVP